MEDKIQALLAQMEAFISDIETQTDTLCLQVENIINKLNNETEAIDLLQRRT